MLLKGWSKNQMNSMPRAKRVRSASIYNPRMNGTLTLQYVAIMRREIVNSRQRSDSIINC